MTAVMRHKPLSVAMGADLVGVKVNLFLSFVALKYTYQLQAIFQ